VEVTSSSPQQESSAEAGLRLDPSTEPFGPSRLDRAELVALASACGLPRVSLFWPLTAEGGPPHQARLAVLVREAEVELSRRGVGHDVAAAILAPARRLARVAGPPPSCGSSLGLLASESEARLFALPQPVRARAWVSGRYRPSPLVPLVESDLGRTSVARRRVTAAIGTNRIRLDLPSVLAMARADRLEILLAAHDAAVWGTFGAAGRVEIHASRRPDDEELVDLTVAHALGHDVEVHVVPRAQIPGGRVVAALTRA
jgi:hypothetical protein